MYHNNQPNNSTHNNNTAKMEFLLNPFLTQTIKLQTNNVTNIGEDLPLDIYHNNQPNNSVIFLSFKLALY